MTNLKRVYLITALLAAVLTAALHFLESTVSPISLINLKGRDLFFRLRNSVFDRPIGSEQIVLINLDDETLRRIQTRWPYPRSIYAEALRRLKPFSPKAVGFDLIFSGNDLSVANDAEFVKALKGAGNVVIATHQNKHGEIGPAPTIREGAWRVGIVDKPRDADRVIRRAYAVFSPKDQSLRSWEVELFEKAFPKMNVSSFLLTGGPFVIDYRIHFDNFSQVSFWRLLEGSVLAKEIRNKIVLIGLTAEAFHDFHSTPIGTMPGLAVNANVFFMFMNQRFFGFGPKEIAPALSFCSFWLVLLAAFFGPLSAACLVLLLLSFLHVAVSFFLFSNYVILDFWLLIFGMIVCVFGAFLFRQIDYTLENRKLKRESAPDPLTGFYTGSFLKLKLKSVLKRLLLQRSWRRNQSEVSIVVFDIDRFGEVNDQLGRSAGDRLLRVVAETIRSSVRKNELICRYGGDGFCVILPATSIQDAARFAQKICATLGAYRDLPTPPLYEGRTSQVSISAGVVSTSMTGTTSSEELLEAADLALIQARSKGGNQVCVMGLELAP